MLPAYHQNIIFIAIPCLETIWYNASVRPTKNTVLRVMLGSRLCGCVRILSILWKTKENGVNMKWYIFSMFFFWLFMCEVRKLFDAWMSFVWNLSSGYSTAFCFFRFFSFLVEIMRKWFVIKLFSCYLWVFFSLYLCENAVFVVYLFKQPAAISNLGININFCRCFLWYYSAWVR